MFDLTPYRFRGNRGISEYNPFRFFDDFEKNFFSDNMPGEFRTDIQDKGSELVLEADLPGMSKDDIHVDIDDGYLTISASRKSEKEEKDNKGNFIRRERSYGSFVRSFDVSGIKTDEISAKYADGVLTLTLPKKEETVPASRRLEIQ